MRSRSSHYPHGTHKTSGLMTLLLATVTSMGIASLIVPSASASDEVGPQAEHTASLKCSKPSGNRANYSWNDGSTTVTVYFNNHCSHKVDAKLTMKNPLSGHTYTRCMTTNGGTKGSDSFVVGEFYLEKITKGC
jgi:hypothetical protein